MSDVLAEIDRPDGIIPVTPESVGALVGEIRLLRAALGAMWRPISEAPKDGTEILLFTHQDVDDFCDEAFGAVQIGYWDDGNDAPGTVWHRDAGWILQKIGEPLAWQPLPSPPAQEGR